MNLKDAVEMAKVCRDWKAQGMNDGMGEALIALLEFAEKLSKEWIEESQYEHYSLTALQLEARAAGLGREPQ